MIVWMIAEVYVFVLSISRLILIKTYVILYCTSGQISIYKGSVAEILKDLEMIIMICPFKIMFK